LQAPVEVRCRAPHLLPSPGAGQRPVGQAKLLQDGLQVQIQVKIISTQ
jgi:hypothetical protein